MKIFILLIAVFFSAHANALEIFNCDNPDWNQFGCEIHKNTNRIGSIEAQSRKAAVEAASAYQLAKENETQALRFERQTTGGIAALSAFSSIPYLSGDITMGLGAGYWNNQAGGAVRLDYRWAGGMTFSGGMGGAGNEQVYSLGIGFRLK